LILAISIEKQNLKLYDVNGLFAETPVSTGSREFRCSRVLGATARAAL